MKTLIPFTLAAALVASGIAQAQTPAFSKPSGYVTETLAPNQFNLVGLTLQNSPIASGDFEVVSGTSLTDNQLAITTQVGRKYVLEILSGSLSGTIQEIPSASISGTTITTPQNLQSLGLAAGVKYSLRLAPTLEEIFKVGSDSSLTRALSSGNADIVWVPKGDGSYTKYYVNVSASEFRNADTNVAAPNVSIIYADGLLVQKRSTSSSVVMTGQVKVTSTNSVLKQGFNLVSLVSPVGSTLFNSGIEDDITAALSEGNADVVYIPVAGGNYNRYFRHPANGGSWRSTAAPGVPITVDISLPSAIFIQRKLATPSNLSLTVPASYSNL